MIPLLICLLGIAAIAFTFLYVAQLKQKTHHVVSAQLSTTTSSLPPFLPTGLTRMLSEDSTDLAGRRVTGLSKSEAEQFLDWLENQDTRYRFELIEEHGHFSIHIQNPDFTE